MHFLFIIGVLLWLAVGNASAAPATTADYEAYFRTHEGVRYKVYGRGPREPYLVGYGHRLTYAERRAHPNPIYTHNEVMQFFYADLARAIEVARAMFKTFDEQPAQVQIILTSLAYQCGPTGMRKWKGLAFAIDRELYVLAANEIGRSLWYRKQVSATRANHAFRTMLNAGLRIQISQQLPTPSP